MEATSGPDPFKGLNRLQIADNSINSSTNEPKMRTSRIVSEWLPID